MGKFKRGIKRGKEPSKSVLVEKYEERFKLLVNSLQGLQTTVFKQIENLTVKNAALARQIEAMDFRSVATRDLAIKGNLFTDSEHTDHARQLRIDLFEEQSKKDDEMRGLITPTEDRSVKLGDFVILEIEAKNPDTIEVPSIKGKSEIKMQDADGKGETIETKETQPHPNAGEKIDSLTFLRSKAQVGSNELMLELEQQLVGMKKGEAKDIQLKMPARYADFTGKEVIFSVNVIDIKEAKPKEELKVVPSKESDDVETKENEKTEK